jgi:hypothetical protein
MIKIINKPTRQMYGFEGMNKDAAKILGYPWKYGATTIIIDKNIHGRERTRTRIHELVEKHYMDKGWPYWKAHKKATDAEKHIR